MNQDKCMEAARVWMTSVGNADITTLNVTVCPAGTPVDHYDNGSVDYPEPVIMLTADYMAAGFVVFASIDENKFKKYPAPSHWQMPKEKAEDPDFIRKITQDIIDNAEIVEFKDIDKPTLNTISGLVKKTN